MLVDNSDYNSDSGEDSSSISSDHSDHISSNEHFVAPKKVDDDNGAHIAASLSKRLMSTSHRNTSVKASVNSKKVSKIHEILMAVMKLVSGCDSVLWYRNTSGRTPYLERLHHLRLVALASNNNDKEDNTKNDTNLEQDLQNVVVNDEIASFIRSYCIRNFSRDKIMESLYYVGEERHIEFDLGGVPNDEISSEYLEQLSKHLKFESILKYVALPKLTLESPPRAKQGKQRSDKMVKQRGRSDLVAVFKWLRDNGVRQILKIIVVDDRDPCHSNLSIETALEGFDVEIWDWKKIDLGLDVIHKSTLCVKEICLYCSGSNAVLMGWASPKGLPNEKYFPKLEKVTVYIRQGYDSRERLMKYIKEFKESIRVASSRSNTVTIDCVVDDGPVSYASEFQSSTGSQPPKNRWIDCLKRFSRFLGTAENSESMRCVKIAIIDDGVDASMSELDGKITAGKSFSPYANSQDLMSPYFVSSSNHGTCMALLICELCPMVELYVAKLDQREVMGSSQRHITTKSATEAFQWATKCGVDIISTSWTIETPVQGNSEMNKLEEAVKHAVNNGILIFCSTSDQGSQTKDDCFPGDFSGCIKIGSATDTGDAMTWVNTEKVHYLLPGVNIPFPSNRGKNETHNESGSSVATAAASGLASLLIFASWLLNKQDTFFKEYRNMNQAFRNLSRGKKYPLVYDLLESFFINELSKIENRGKDPGYYSLSNLVWNENCRKALQAVIDRVKDKLY